MDRRRRTGRRIALRRTTVLVLVTGMAMTVATVVLTRHVTDRGERALIEQRHAGARLLMTYRMSELLFPLRSAGTALGATGGDRDAFQRALTPILTPGNPVAAAALLQLRGSAAPPEITMRAGAQLALDREPRLLAALGEVTAAGELAVLDLIQSPVGRRLGLARRAPGHQDLIVYGELLLPPPGTTLMRDHAFDGLDFAVYLDPSRRPESAVITTVNGPITGPQAASTFPFGSAHVTLVVAARSPLSGPLAAGLPWLVLVAGLVMVGGASASVELIGRRGDTAVRLGDDLRARSAELAQAEQRFRSLVEQMPAVTYVLDVDEQVVRYMSPQIERLSGVPPGQWSGRAAWPVEVHPHDRDDLPRWERADFSSAPSLSREYRLLRPGGETVWVHEVAAELPRAPGGHRMVQAVLSDITELKRVEEALSAERDFSDALMDSLPAVFLFYDERGRFRRWNRNFEQVTGYSHEETAQLDPLDLFVPEDRERIAQRIEEAFERGEAEDETTLLTRDGTRRDYYFTGRRVVLPQGACLVGVGIDVTEKRRAEREISELNATLEQRVLERTAELTVANRELDSFAGAVSHDLRAPLRAIDGFSLALIEDAGDALGDAGRRHLERVRNATRRMGELIDDLLDLSRVTRTAMVREHVDLSALARSVSERLREAEPDRSVELRVAPAAVARGDRRLLRIVLENLLGNSWKFSRHRDVARIEFGVDREDGVDVYFVADNGAGFDPAYADKLFEPFGRLHPAREFEGTGIGLATVARIIHRHGGRVWAAGEAGRGARVSFTCEHLPRSDDPPAGDAAGPGGDEHGAHHR